MSANPFHVIVPLRRPLLARWLAAQIVNGPNAIPGGAYIPAFGKNSCSPLIL